MSKIIVNTKLKGISQSRRRYSTDFDFALASLPDRNLFYVFPVKVFIGYASEIHVVEAAKRQRKPNSAKYRDAGNLISQWAARGGTRVRSLPKSGKPVAG